MEAVLILSRLHRFGQEPFRGPEAGKRFRDAPHPERNAMHIAVGSNIGIFSGPQRTGHVALLGKPLRVAEQITDNR